MILISLPHNWKEINSFKGRTIRKVIRGGEGTGEVQKKYSHKGKLNEKNSCTPINPKKYSCYDLKKNHTRNLITKKHSCGSKIPPPPPINIFNGPSLSCIQLKVNWNVLFNKIKILYIYIGSESSQWNIICTVEPR